MSVVYLDRVDPADAGYVPEQPALEPAAPPVWWAVSYAILFAGVVFFGTLATLWRFEANHQKAEAAWYRERWVEVEWEAAQVRSPDVECWYKGGGAR